MQTVTLTHKKTLYESIVLRSLSKMNRGKIDIFLPTGEYVQIGEGNGSIHASIHITDSRFFENCVLYGDIGFGESYTDGYWETDNITEVIKWFLLNIDTAPALSGSQTKAAFINMLRFINRLKHSFRKNNLSAAKANISRHYDLNNDFFKLFLDPTMTYSSAYFEQEGMELLKAQIAKYESLCNSMKIKPGDHVLEIGSGWGGNAIHLAKNHNCRVTTVTISEKQYKFAQEQIQKENLAEKVDIKLMDYRHISGQFDKIVSIEMLEAVGHEFLDVFFKKCHDLLKPKGVLGLQVITCPDSRYESLRDGVDWIQKHVFPGSLLPSVSAINSSINRTGEMTLMHLKEMGLHYAQTLRIWKKKFNENLAEVRQLEFDESFIRKWNYYLSYCEAAFDMRNISVMQMVYTRPNNLDF